MLAIMLVYVHISGIGKGGPGGTVAPPIFTEGARSDIYYTQFVSSLGHKLKLSVTVFIS